MVTAYALNVFFALLVAKVTVGVGYSLYQVKEGVVFRLREEPPLAPLIRGV